MLCRSLCVAAVCFLSVVSVAPAFGQAAVAEINGNGMKGSNKALLNLRLQYVVRPSTAKSVGFFAEIHNATNRVNFDNPITNRRSPNFNRTTIADEPLMMQLGVRYTF